MVEVRITSLQNELLGANQAVLRLEEEARELRNALHKSSEDVRSAQLELAVLKGSPLKVVEHPGAKELKELQRELEAMRELVAVKDSTIAEKGEEVALLQREVDGLRRSLRADVEQRSDMRADGGEESSRVAGASSHLKIGRERERGRGREGESEWARKPGGWVAKSASVLVR
jgi:chromosome segregation ATPase